MRRLSDNHSRHVCRWAFLLLCVLPTALVIYSASRVWSVEDWELMIAAGLNLDVEIERVENPLPGRTILHQVQLLRGKKLVGRVGRMEWNSLGEQRLNLTGAALNPSGIELLRLALGQLDERYGTLNRTAWLLSSPDLLIESEPEEGSQPISLMRLANFELLSSPQEKQSLFLLRLQFAESVESKDYPIELRISRAVVGGQQQCFLRVTEQTPTWLLASLGCFPKNWDDQLLFRGTIDFRESGNGATTGQVEGAVLSNVDLSVLQDSLGQTLSGRAEVQVPDLAWRDGRVFRADLQVHAAEGELSRAWLAALTRIHGLRDFLPEAETDAADVQAFRLFAARLQLSSGTCRVSPVTQATAAICWDAADNPLLAIDQPGYAQADLEVLARLCLEPRHPELLADDQLVELLSLFHLPPDTRSARQPNGQDLR